MAKDVSTALPQLDLTPGSIILVELDDPAATITELVLHGWQETGGAVQNLSPVGGAYIEGEQV